MKVRASVKKICKDWTARCVMRLAVFAEGRKAK